MYFDFICDQVVGPNVSENGSVFIFGSLLDTAWSANGSVGDLLEGLLGIAAFVGGLGCSGGAPGKLLEAQGMLRGGFGALLGVIWGAIWDPFGRLWGGFLRSVKLSDPEGGSGGSEEGRSVF